MLITSSRLASLCSKSLRTATFLSSKMASTRSLRYRPCFATPVLGGKSAEKNWAETANTVPETETRDNGCAVENLKKAMKVVDEFPAKFASLEKGTIRNEPRVTRSSAKRSAEMECSDGKEEKIQAHAGVSASAGKGKPAKNGSKNVKAEKAIKFGGKNSKVKTESRGIRAENDDDLVGANSSAGLPSRKRKLTDKSTKVEGTTESGLVDIEDLGWRPHQWEQVLSNILKMRKLHVAPVDSMGSEECPDKGAKPEVFRYQTLISVMLSSQTKDEVTHAATQRLIKHGLNVDNILATPDEKIGELIYPAGFWKTKVKYIKSTTRILKEQYGGDVPRTLKELCKLPGVGPKMANIVMSVAWKDTVGIAVDTHVHRIANRLGWVPKPTKTPEKTRRALESWLPKKHWDHINVDMVGLGQTVCRPVGPRCSKCLNSSFCPFGKTFAVKLSKRI